MSGLSLWISPPRSSALGGFITRLSSLEEASPDFNPHATLVSDAIVPAKSVPDLVSAIEGGIAAWKEGGHAPLELVFKDVRQGALYYQCVLAAIEPSTSLVSLHEALLHAFELPVPSPRTYFPHLSLIYGDLTSERKAQIIADLEASGDVRPLKPDGVEVVGERGFTPMEVLLVRTNGLPHEWEVLARIALPGAEEERQGLTMLGGKGAACEGDFCEA